MNVKDLMIGNYIYHNGDITIVSNLDIGSKSYCTINDVQIHKETFLSKQLGIKIFKGIRLTEEILLKCGFGVVTESSAGKRYAYLNNGVFSSNLAFTYWVIGKTKNKFFRGDLECKYVHELQNLYTALSGKELQINL